LSGYVKIAEATVIMEFAQDTIRKWGEQGELLARRQPANGFRLYRRRDLEQFLWFIRLDFRANQSDSVGIYSPSDMPQGLWRGSVFLGAAWEVPHAG
jgi:hypothetical protein